MGHGSVPIKPSGMSWRCDCYIFGTLIRISGADKDYRELKAWKRYKTEASNKQRARRMLRSTVFVMIIYVDFFSTEQQDNGWRIFCGESTFFYWSRTLLINFLLMFKQEIYSQSWCTTSVITGTITLFFSSF